MPRQARPLTARFVATTQRVGYHCDGAGLYLRVTESGARNWLFRFARNGHKREMGLGSANVVSLMDARQRARDAANLIAAGSDPITARRTARLAERPKTWGECVDEYISTVVAPGKKDTARASKGTVHSWKATLALYGPDRKLQVREVTAPVILACLKPIWTAKAETARKLRQRLEKILAYATAPGQAYRTGDNPASLTALEGSLPKSTARQNMKSRPAMPYTELPAFMRKLRERKTQSARALELMIYTTARTGEVCGNGLSGFEWAELAGDTWTIPPERMKGRQAGGLPHTVPLVAEARAVFAGLSRKTRRPLDMSENTVRKFLQEDMGCAPYTPHGMRAAFSTWADEETQFPPELVEAQLAHVEEDKTKDAYKRNQARKMLPKRRQLLEAWALFLAGKPYPKKLRDESDE